MTKTENQEAPKQSKLFMELIINLVIPSLLLSKAEGLIPGIDSVGLLLIALSFPFFYGAWDFFSNKHFNFIALLGLVNLLLTGGLGLLQLEGIYFAIKEAAVPFVIGVAVFWSSYSKQTLLEKLLFNDQVFKVQEIMAELAQRNNEETFHQGVKKINKLFSLSFMLSALINYVLAIRVFTEIPSGLDETKRQVILNEQIAQMNWMGYVVTIVPSLLFLGYLFYLINKLLISTTEKKLTDFIRQ